MPILLKSIKSNIISLFGSGESNFTAPVTLITSVVGQAGLEDYIHLTTFEALTQDFSQIGEAEFCDRPATYGVSTCTTYTDLNISL